MDHQLERVDIIGVPITATNMRDCTEYLTANLENIRGEYICVSNVHTTVMAHDDPNYFRVQANSLMSVPDGKPLSVIGRKDHGSMDRVTGPDLMREIFSLSGSCGSKHYFYGGTEDNLNLFIRTIEAQYPNIEIVGFEPSVFRELSETEEDDLAERINKTKADYIWIGTGAPRQEMMCYRFRGKLCGVMVGVGGAFNVLSGAIPEAPQWMQNMSLEWLYRLIQEPGRLFKRYLVTNTKFIFYYLTNKQPRRS